MWKLVARHWKQLIERTWRQCWKDRVLNQSAMLAFYFLLSMFPLFIFLMALLGMLLQSRPVLQGTLHEYLVGVVPESALALVDKTLREITRSSGALKLSTALLFTWWSASRGMMGIIEGLNTAYEVKESRPWWKKQLLTSGLTIVSLVLFASALLLMIYGGRFSVGHGAFIAVAWQVLARVLALAFVLLAFNILYVYAPNVERRHWYSLMPGTVVGVALWLLGSVGFRLYLEVSNTFTTTYGSLGAVVILLLWLYLSGIAIFVGGEMNSELEKASHA